MTQHRSNRALAIQLLLAAAGAGLCGTVVAAGLSMQLANGQTLSVIESSTPQRTGFSFERRYPDGARDRQFGSRGRVNFEMGNSGSVPTAIGTDASGNFLLSGSAPFSDRSRGAVVVRFLSMGQIDSRWGDQGLARMPVASGNSVATDVLPRADGSLLVVGTVEDGGSQQASIWSVDPTGHADLRFGRQGAMLAIALPLSQVLSIQQGPDGALEFAIQTSQGGRSWLEMHRWQAGDAIPRRVARQEVPEQWVGPASLVLQSGQWFWRDSSQPQDHVPVVMLQDSDSPWEQLESPQAPAVEPIDNLGHAAMNPYAGAAVGLRSAPAHSGPIGIWSVLLAAAVLSVCALILRRFRL
jgi:hypothetical protein